MLLSVYMPHNGRDVDDYIEALETVRDTLTEGRKAGATDFLAETLTLSLDWTTRAGGGEDVITYEKKI